MGRFSYKVPGGKLLCAKVEVTDGRVTRLQFTGDFFMAPERDLEDLEGKLAGLKAETATLGTVIEEHFTVRGTRITGASIQDFVYVLSEALRQA